MKERFNGALQGENEARQHRKKCLKSDRAFRNKKGNEYIFSYLTSSEYDLPGRCTMESNICQNLGYCGNEIPGSTE